MINLDFVLYIYTSCMMHVKSKLIDPYIDVCLDYLTLFSLSLVWFAFSWLNDQFGNGLKDLHYLLVQSLSTWEIIFYLIQSQIFPSGTVPAIFPTNKTSRWQKLNLKLLPEPPAYSQDLPWLQKDYWSSRNSKFQVALVELQYQKETPAYLLIILGVVTTLLVSVHLIALMMSTCIRPFIDAYACNDEFPHRKFRYTLISIYWESLINFYGFTLFTILDILENPVIKCRMTGDSRGVTTLLVSLI